MFGETDDDNLIIVDGEMMPLSTYRSDFQTTWREAVADLSIHEAYKSQAYAISAAAFACCQYRALTLSRVPVGIGDRNKRPTDWSPIENYKQHFPKLLWHIEMSLLIWGVAYLRKHPNEWGYPTHLEWLHPEDVSPREDNFYQVYEYFLMPQGTVLKRDQVIEIRRFDPQRQLNGKSEYEVAMGRIITEKSLITHAGSFFFNSARPDGILVSKVKMSKEDREKAKRDWEGFKGSRNSWKTFVSGGDWEWIPITINPVDLNMGELKDDLRRDICAIFRTHGALVGLGSVSDPLSSGSTLASIQRDHAQSTTVPEFESIANELNEQWLWTDFDDKNLWSIFPDTAKMPVLSGVTTDLSAASASLTTPTSPILDYSEARELMGLTASRDYLIRPPDQSVLMYSNQLMTANEARNAVGLPNLPVDFLRFPDGRLVSIEDLPNELGKPIPTPMSIPLLPVTANRSGVGCSIVLAFPGNSSIAAIQTIFKELMGEGPVWIEPEDFHVTLVDVPVLSPEDQESLYPFLKNLPAIDLTINGVGVFENENTDVVYLGVDCPDVVISLQKRVVDHLIGVGLSDHFDPSNWTPHITLCYCPKGTSVPSLDDYRIKIRPKSLDLTKSDYTPVFSIPVSRSVRAETRIEVDLSGHNFVKTAQRVANSLTFGEEVDWYPPDSYCLVLAYSAAAPQEIDAQGLHKISVKTSNYYSESGEIFVGIADSPELEDFAKTALFSLDQFRRVSPRIPLGKALGKFPDKDLGESDGYLIVLNNLTVSNGNKKLQREIRGRSYDYRKELKNWEMVASRKGREVQFQIEHLDKFIADFIRSALTDTDLTLAEIFRKASDLAENGLTYHDPDEFITPEEFENYWKNFDTLQADISTNWLEYMDLSKKGLQEEISKGGSAIPVLQTHHDSLKDSWVGSVDNPGPLTALIFAGMAAGNDELIKATRSGESLTISWELLAKEAYDFAKTYVYTLIKGIDKTTNALLQSIYSEWVASGKPLKDLVDAIEIVTGDRDRAALISQSESIRVYNEGAFKRWQSVGVTQSKWRTVQDGKVCKVCRSLNGQIADINVGWIDPTSGKIYRSSAHAGCRCPRSPVVVRGN